MTYPAGRVAVAASLILSTCWIASCGSYDNASDAATGGSSPTGGVATGGVSAATGGSAVATGGTTGGVSTTGGQVGTGGAPINGSGGETTAGGGSGGGSGGSGGSNGGPVDCTDKAACGGDVVGSWTAAGCEISISGMANMVPTGLGCAMAPVTGSLKVTGVWTAMADGTFVDKTTTSGEAVILLAKECLTISGFAATCDRIVLDPLGLVSTVCVDDPATEGCTCTSTINQPGSMAAISIDASFNDPEGAAGTYMIAGNTLVTTTEGVDSEYSYCAAENTLTANLTTVTHVGTLTGPIVLQKQ